VHKKLGEMIALDCQPLTIVEDIGLNSFNSFVKKLEPRYVIPSRKYFSGNVIPGDESRTYEKGTLTFTVLLLMLGAHIQLKNHCSV